MGFSKSRRRWGWVVEVELTHINPDDIRTGYDGLDDRGMDFNILGKDILSDPRKSFTRDLYATDQI